MINRYNKAILLIFNTLLLLVLFSSCDPARKYEEREKEEIQDYLSRNSNLSFELKPSGLYYLEVEAGNGLSPVDNDSVFVTYTGLFLGGTIFDSNAMGPDTYGYVAGANRNVEGFNEGISYMKEGGKALILIPSSLGWGAAGSWPYIEGYTPVLFQLELVQVKKPVGR